MNDTTDPSGSAAPPSASAPPPPGTDAPAAPVRPLRRSSRDRWLGGVASGLARYLDVDPVLVRVALIALGIIAFFPLVVLYVAALFVIPSDDAPDARGEHPIDRRTKLLAAIAGVVLLVGLLVDAEHEGSPIYTPWLVLFAALVLTIVWLVRRDRGTWGPAPWAGRESAAPWAGAAPPGTPVPADAASDAPTVTVPATPYPPQVYAAAPAAAGSGQPPYATYPPYPPAPADEPVRERSALGALTFGAALLTAGVLVALDRGDVLDVPAVVVLGSALAVVALGLVVGAWVGRARGLIGLGIVLAILTMLASIVNFPASNSVGEQQWRPLTAADVESSYAWGVGEVDLDLSRVSSAGPVTTSLELGVGDARIHVPATAVVELRAEVGAGEIVVHNGDGTVFSADGMNRDESTRSEPSEEEVREAGEDAPPTTFVIEASVGLGRVEVIRA